MTCLIMTMDEMLRLALGTFALDHVNIGILHNFLKFIIRKLEIQNEFVEITGPEAGDLRQMLCHARDPVMNFKNCHSEDSNDSNENETCCYTSEKVTNMEEEISRLTELVNKMETDLKAHLEKVEHCKQPTPFRRRELKTIKKKAPIFDEESFSSECEDLCAPCDKKNLIACELLQNATFLKKLMRRISAPIIDRIFEFEQRIGILNEKFQNFLNLAEDEYKKVPLIEDCFLEMDLVKEEIARNQNEFLETMKEVQDMLDAKVDKIHIPPLKKYIKDRMDDIERQLKELMYKEQCPKAAGVLVTNLQCLCCTTKVCQKDRIYPVPLLANAVPRDTTKPMPGRQPVLCIPKDRERACGGDHTIIRPGEKSLMKSNLIDDFGDKAQLRIGTDNVKYFKGLDGGMYRLAPNSDVPHKSTNIW